MKVRVRFTKENEMRYVGHLDIMRYFQKAIRRAGFDISYSKGFSPHQIISFASPLGLGMTSEGEYFDAEFESCEKSDIMIKRFNDVMTDGIRVISFKILPENEKTNAMASLAAARYELFLSDDLMTLLEASGGIENIINRILSKDEIVIHKATKRNEIDVDIKPLIYSLESTNNVIKMFIAAGSVNTIKVSAIMDILLKEANINISGNDAFIKGLYDIKRIDQFLLKNEKYISLSEVGKDYE